MYGTCLISLRLKTIDVVIRNTKEAEDTLKSYETRLRDVSKVPAEVKELEDHRNLLKVQPPRWRSGSAARLFLLVVVVVTFALF